MDDTIRQIKSEVKKWSATYDLLDHTQLETILSKIKRADSLQRIQKFNEKISDFDGFDYAILPEENIKRFRSSLGGAADSLKHILAQVNASKEFSTGMNDNALDAHLRQFDENSTAAIMGFLVFLNYESYITNFSVDSIAIGTKAAIIQSKNEFFAFIKDQQAEMAKAIGTAKYSEIFAKESTSYRRNANWWLGATIGMLAITLGFALYLLNNFSEISDSKGVVQLTVTKIIIATALFYAINMCLKSYRSQKHNQIINQHRHNALKTFEVFQKVSTDEQTKNAVLLEVTRTIFGNQQTGYTSTTDSEGEGMHSKIIEITKMGSK